MASNSGWNKSLPSNTSKVADGDDEFRSVKSFMQAWWEQEHYATDGSQNSAGVHKPGSARVHVAAASALSNPDTGRLFVATDTPRLWAAPSNSSFSVYGNLQFSGTTSVSKQTIGNNSDLSVFIPIVAPAATSDPCFVGFENLPAGDVEVVASWVTVGNFVSSTSTCVLVHIFNKAGGDVSIDTQNFRAIVFRY